MTSVTSMQGFDACHRARTQNRRQIGSLQRSAARICSAIEVQQEREAQPSTPCPSDYPCPSLRLPLTASLRSCNKCQSVREWIGFRPAPVQKTQLATREPGPCARYTRTQSCFLVQPRALQEPLRFELCRRGSATSLDAQQIRTRRRCFTRDR